MAGHKNLLPFPRADFTTHAVGITDGNIQKVPFSRGLVMRDGTLHHVAEVIKLVAQVLHFFPTSASLSLIHI